MCGIAGIFRYRDATPAENDRHVAQRMVDSLVHRGPDDGGLLLQPGLALGHRRLAILDLSERGRQPMCDASGRLWIAYNGEIYNYREIRSRLERAGHRFRTETDTEVILYAYREWGLDCAGLFNGMFAFALWDAERRRLWLARDAVGIKPLFYRDDGKVLHFGSEIKAILADERIPRRPDWCAIDDFLTFGYMPAPRTGFDGIQQLLPGHALVVEQGAVRQYPYYDWPYPSEPTDWDERRSIDELATALRASVGRQMVSDVPVGAFLSGGVDSSAVVAAMRQHALIPPKAFCVGFAEDSFDESAAAAEVADLLGVDLHVEQMVPQLEQLLLHAVSHAEEPLADNSMLGVFLLCQSTRPHVKVALSGDGADELLGGYATYHASTCAAWYRRVPVALRRGLVRPLVDRWPSSGRKYAAADIARRFVAGAEAGRWRDHASWRRILSDEQKRLLYTSDMMRAVAGNDPLSQYVQAGAAAPRTATSLERHLQMDLGFHLPNDMLVKVDRMSMAHSLEVRVPLLDRQMIETALCIPSHYKVRGRCGKYVLKRVLEEHLPARITRRKKAGFLLPIERWLAGTARPLLYDYVLSSGLVDFGVLAREPIEQLVRGSERQIRASAYELFAVLVLSMWWAMWIEQTVAVACVRPASARATRIIQNNGLARLSRRAA